MKLDPITGGINPTWLAPGFWLRPPTANSARLSLTLGAKFIKQGYLGTVVPSVGSFGEKIVSLIQVGPIRPLALTTAILPDASLPRQEMAWIREAGSSYRA
jgi:hypothetical protein